MTSAEISTSTTRQAVEAKGRSAPLKVTGKLRTAIELMVWKGARRAEAAEQAGLTDHGVRNALNKPHVKAALLREMEVLRLSERPRNILRLAQIRDAADNMPAVNAIKMLEDMGTDQQAKSNASVSLPGLTIQIINAPGLEAARAVTVENGAQLVQLSGSADE